MEPAEAKKFVDDLMDRRRALWGPEISDAPLDKQALELLKQQLQKSSKAIKVK